MSAIDRERLRAEAEAAIVDEESVAAEAWRMGREAAQYIAAPSVGEPSSDFSAGYAKGYEDATEHHRMARRAAPSVGEPVAGLDDSATHDWKGSTAEFWKARYFEAVAAPPIVPALMASDAVLLAQAMHVVRNHRFDKSEALHHVKSETPLGPHPLGNDLIDEADAIAREYAALQGGSDAPA